MAIISNTLSGRDASTPFVLVLKSGSSSAKQLPTHVGNAPGKWVPLFGRQSGSSGSGTLCLSLPSFTKFAVIFAKQANKEYEVDALLQDENAGGYTTMEYPPQQIKPVQIGVFCGLCLC